SGSWDLARRPFCRSRKPPTVLAAVRSAIQERDEHQQKGRRAKSQDPETFSLDAEHMAWYQLQRVKHRKEIPFGPDAGRNSGKRVRLLSKLPRIERGERGQQRERHIPRQDIPQDVVGK